MRKSGSGRHPDAPEPPEQLGKGKHPSGDSQECCRPGLAGVSQAVVSG